VYSAPVSGILGGLGILALGLAWLERRRRAAAARGEGYGKHALNEPEAQAANAELPSWMIGALPLLTVLVVNFAVTRFVSWDANLLAEFQAMKLPLVAASVKSVLSIWSLIIALVCGIVLAVALGAARLPKDGLAKSLNAGAVGSLLAIMNTASEVGYGNVIASLPGFKAISAALMSIKIGGTPLVSEAVTVNVLAGITGSASGGMSIALDLMSKDWLAWANSIGMSPEILHRVASMASGGMDTLPHNGAVITLLAVCGLTHRDSYGDIFAMTVIKTSMVFVVILFHTLTGIL
jgi:H+/gluconate symporter-like permease